jgi:hypothetical protein
LLPARRASIELASASTAGIGGQEDLVAKCHLREEGDLWWSLVAGRWSLVAGRWSLVANFGSRENRKEKKLWATVREGNEWSLWITKVRNASRETAPGP